MLQGHCTFPGIEQIVEAQFSFVNGISPSVATLTIAPQDHVISEGGTLRFFYGDRVLEFPGCKIDSGSLQRNNQGQVWRLSIWDRRWRWSLGAISGSYNSQSDDGELVKDMDEQPQELAKFCLDAIGEQGYDVSEIPNESNPKIDWDYDVPMEALASLCDQLGCRVVLGFDNRVRIRRAGVGKSLPIDNDVLENSLTVDPPEMPDKIAVVCGPTRFQDYLPLEAVGLDMEKGKEIIVPIDELSYKPAKGWNYEFCEDGEFYNVALQSSEADWRRARKTVFRWYRVKMPWPPRKNEFREIPDLDHIIIYRKQVEKASITDGRGFKTDLPAVAVGVFFDEGGTSYDNTALTTIVDREEISYSLNSSTGVVSFSRPMYKNVSDGDFLETAAAELYVKTSFSVRDPDNHAIQRYVRSRDTGGRFGTPTLYLHHEKLTLAVVDGEPINKEVVDTACDYYIDAAIAEYRLETPQTVLYTGLRIIELDGAVGQLTVSLSARGMTTRVSHNAEQLEYTPDYKQRRQLEEQRDDHRRPHSYTKQVTAPNGGFTSIRVTLR